jgi:hypothetical protein
LRQPTITTAKTAKSWDTVMFMDYEAELAGHRCHAGIEVIERADPNYKFIILPLVMAAERRPARARNRRSSLAHYSPKQRLNSG